MKYNFRHSVKKVLAGSIVTSVCVMGLPNAVFANEFDSKRFEHENNIGEADCKKLGIGDNNDSVIKKEKDNTKLVAIGSVQKEEGKPKEEEKTKKEYKPKEEGKPKEEDKLNEGNKNNNGKTSRKNHNKTKKTETDSKPRSDVELEVIEVEVEPNVVPDIEIQVTPETEVQIELKTEEPSENVQKMNTPKTGEEQTTVMYLTAATVAGVLATINSVARKRTNKKLNNN